MQVNALISSTGAKTILVYASLDDEVPTLDFLNSCYEHAIVFDEDKAPTRKPHIVLPCVFDDKRLVLRRFTSPQDLVIKGKYLIPEPTGQIFNDYKNIDLAIIPGMAFDSHGHRLGRGKGYYDRLLSHPEFRNICKVGVCFDFQYFDTIPAEPHDVLMDKIITISTQ